MVIKSEERTTGRQKAIANKGKEDKPSSTQIYNFLIYIHDNSGAPRQADPHTYRNS